MRVLTVALLLMLVPALAGCMGDGEQEARGVTHAPAETVAPDFSVTTLDGEEITLSDLQGRAVLVEFMGLGCTSCRAALPDHQELWAQYGDDPRFLFLAVNVWSVWCGDLGCGTTGESEEEMRAYREEHQIGWPMAQAPAHVPGAYNVQGTPTHFFIDPDGHVHAAAGKVPYETMADEVEHILEMTA